MSERTVQLSDTYYGSWAHIYDLVATAPGVRSWRERTATSLGLEPGETVVDMGCGTGANFPYLRERVGSEGQVIGIDLVGAMLEQARSRIDRHNWDNVHVVRGDATQFEVESVDAILSTFLVGMLSEPGSAVRSWLGLVSPGGRVSLLNAGRSDRLLVRPINLACRAFVRLTAPGYRFRLRSPIHNLEARWNEATEALFEGTIQHESQQIGLGFVRLASGTIPDETDRE